MEKFDKRMNKMDAETLQQFLAFRKRANKIPAKKGKGSYNRKDFKKGVAQDGTFSSYLPRFCTWITD